MQTFILSAVLLCSLGAVSAGWKYKFKPFTSQTNCLTVTGGGNGDGNGYSVATCDAANTYQNFEELQLQGNTALLTLLTGMTTECSIKALAGVAGTAPNGAPTELVQQMAWNPSNKAHYWTQQAQGLLPGYFWLKNFASGMCATAESLGTYVDDYACTGGAIHQLWSLSAPNAATDQGSTLNNQLYIATNPCLKVNGAYPGPNVGTSTAACAAGDYSQAFYPIRQNGTHWKAVGSARCIDGGGSATLAYQYACVGTAQNQQWVKFNYPGEAVPGFGFKYFMDILSGLCLTWDPASATNIHTETCVQGNTNQQWYTDLVGI